MVFIKIDLCMEHFIEQIQMRNPIVDLGLLVPKSANIVKNKNSGERLICYSIHCSFRV